MPTDQDDPQKTGAADAERGGKQKLISFPGQGTTPPKVTERPESLEKTRVLLASS